MAPPSAAAAAGGLVLWLHGSGETGELSRAQVAPYFSAAPALRLCFPTAPITPIAWNGDEIMINAWFGIPEAPITAVALAVASVLLYPKTLGGCAVFSGSVPLRKSFARGCHLKLERLIQVLDTRWWIKSSSIFDNGYWSV
ncbi:hypothetical protein ACQ4PT_005358 [Festuca glaucescens]